MEELELLLLHFLWRADTCGSSGKIANIRYDISACCSRVVLKELYSKWCCPVSRTGNGIITPLAWHFVNLKHKMGAVDGGDSAVMRLEPVMLGTGCSPGP